jgi:hypothetical protein
MSQIWVMAMDDRRARLFLESKFNLAFPELSPDGRWIAYAASDSGARHVYVQPNPGPGERIRISTTWATEPIWTANGREILFRSGIARDGFLERQQVFSAAIRSTSPFRADPPRLLFETEGDEYDLTSPTRSWDATADGQRFLMLRVAESTDRPPSAIHVVLNWTKDLERRVPAK